MPDLKYFGFFILIFLYACAQITPLTGGPDDIYAPAIDSAKTYPLSGQTNFTDSELNLKFKEYIKLKNPNDNILIIPQQTNTPEYYVKNKRLRITLKDELLENTTYTITFNGAIQDITAGNDSVFQYVFSTGDYIDSLVVRGTVKDAFLNTPQNQFLVGLYPKSFEAHFDSIPFKFKPMYLTQSDKQGKFELNYLKDGVYYIFAIEDKNKNLLYDPGEAFGFIEEQSFLLSSEMIPDLDIRTFKEESTECEIEDVRFNFPGQLEVILSNPTDSIEITSIMGLLQEETGSKDSLIFWLEKSPQKKTQFFIDLLGEKDTIKPIYQNIPDKIESFKMKTLNNVVGGKLLPNEDLKITFSEPVGAVNKELIKFFDVDSNELEMPEYLVEVRDLVFKTAGTKAHEIRVDSAAITSVYERVNEEEIKILFDNETEDYYGTLIVSVDTVFSVPVIVHLLDIKGEVVGTTEFSRKMEFPKLIPGDYQLRLIFDVDNSGDWTAGSLKEGREAERVIYNSEIIKVKSKWEKEVDWKFKD